MGAKWSVHTIVDGVVTTLIGLTCVALIVAMVRPTTRKPPNDLQLPQAPVSVLGASFIGEPAAPVTIVEYSDFQCPYCAAFQRDTFPQLLDKQVKTGHVQIAFVNVPLISIHPQAFAAAVAGVCAAQQGRFLEMKAALFTDPSQLSTEQITSYGASLNLDNAMFSACRESADAHNRVRSDLLAAGKLKVAGTPTFMVGRTVPGPAVDVSAIISGHQPFDRFEEAIRTASERNARR